MKKVIILATAILISTSAWATDSIDEGKKLFQSNCLSCHNAELDPPMAPPMFGVQKHYKRVTSDRHAFIDKVTAFAMNPSEDKALLKLAVKHLGVMPNPGVEEDDLRKIAAYIHDETFAPPCAHWKAGMKATKAKGDLRHFKKAQMRYNKMCVNQPVATKKTAAIASDGSLKQIMQQLGEDFDSLNQAILRENFTEAARASHAIAFHDKPSMAQRMKLMSSLGMEIKNFKKVDGIVHGLAIKLEEAAKAQDMPLLIKHQSHMLSACMACHTSYRSRVVNLLK